MLGNCVFTPSQARTKAQYKVNSKGTSVLSRYSSNMDSSMQETGDIQDQQKSGRKRKTSEREDTNIGSIAKGLGQVHQLRFLHQQIDKELIYHHKQ